MEYLELATEISMPKLGFGTFTLAGAECVKAVDEALALGYRLVDTAEAYGNEGAVGEALEKSDVNREDVFLATKVNFKSYSNARRAAEESLRRLRTDYVDLLLLHWPFADYYAAWRDLEALKTEGKARIIGVSNFEPAQLVDLIAYNDVAPAVNQVEANLYCQRADDRAWMERYGAAPMAYAPLGQGSRSAMYEEQAVRDAAERHGKTEAQVLLRFLAQLGFCAIPRSTEAAHIRENLDIFDFELDAREMDSLRVLDKREPLIGNPLSPDLVLSSLSW